MLKTAWIASIYLPNPPQSLVRSPEQSWLSLAVCSVVFALGVFVKMNAHQTQTWMQQIMDDFGKTETLYYIRLHFIEANCRTKMAKCQNKCGSNDFGSAQHLMLYLNDVSWRPNVFSFPCR